MIVQQSLISLSAEHQKTESSTVTMSSSALAFEQAVAEMEELKLDNQFANWLSDDGQQDGEVVNGAEHKNYGRQLEDSRTSLLLSLIRALQAARSAESRDELDALLDREEPASGGTLMVNGVESPNYDVPTLPRVMRTIEVSMEMTETIEEYEYSSFHASGLIRTADGEEINLNLNLTMERSYKATRSYSETRSYTFTDPLVVNFEGNAADLNEDSYRFDLDADGNDDLIRFVSEQSAFLALDKNKDGVINDGTELFGARSGDGFADLAEYDDDENGYIDEADSIFNELKLWSKAMDGEDILESLADRNIGAIYLGSTETPYDIKDSNNETLAKVRSSGFYLTEAGEVGTVQQVDMVS